jgi:hypothetical protein
MILVGFALVTEVGFLLCLAGYLATFAGLDPPGGPELLGLFLLVLIPAILVVGNAAWDEQDRAAVLVPVWMRVVLGAALLNAVVLHFAGIPREEGTLKEENGAYFLKPYSESDWRPIAEAEYREQLRYQDQRQWAYLILAYAVPVALYYAASKKGVDPASRLGRYPITTVVGTEALVLGLMGSFCIFPRFGSLAFAPGFVPAAEFDRAVAEHVLSFAGKFGLFLTGVLLLKRSRFAWPVLLATFILSAAHSLDAWFLPWGAGGPAANPIPGLILPPVVYLVLLLVLRSLAARRELADADAAPEPAAG